MEKIRFEVEPNALFEVIKALQHNDEEAMDDNYYQTITVKKEKNNLVVVVETGHKDETPMNKIEDLELPGWTVVRTTDNIPKGND